MGHMVHSELKLENTERPLKRKNYAVEQAPELSKIQSDLKSNYPNTEIETDLVNFIKGRPLVHESLTDSLRQLFSHFDKFKYISRFGIKNSGTIRIRYLKKRSQGSTHQSRSDLFCANQAVRGSLHMAIPSKSDK